jgi:uncharacterized protein YneF (UPF0154 family)
VVAPPSKALVIAAIVLGVAAVIGIFVGVFIWKRKKLQSNLDSYEEI